MREQDKQPMINTIPATQVRNQFGEMLKRVYRNGEHLIIEQNGFPVAALLSHAEYEHFRRLLALQQLEELNKAVNREMQRQGITEEQAIAEIEKTKDKVFEKHYAQPRKTRRQKQS